MWGTDAKRRGQEAERVGHKVLQGDVGVLFKSPPSGGSKNYKIPNLKHQMTNKSQISIYNDPNIHYRCFHGFTNPDPPVMISLGTYADGAYVWNFEFGYLGFV